MWATNVNYIRWLNKPMRFADQPTHVPTCSWAFGHGPYTQIIHRLLTTKRGNGNIWPTRNRKAISQQATIIAPPAVAHPTSPTQVAAESNMGDTWQCICGAVFRWAVPLGRCAKRWHTKNQASLMRMQHRWLSPWTTFPVFGWLPW